ncbi:MAG: NTP transferase domain-containing protein [Thermoguttaceae bacterium]|jgi:bifunctional UDP-N-acetylglucosamine pyrophosphorylase/glucosamine-1-phosphate N-acetyltransferase/UDP-N-acetylglucosamine pyrophosphorylase
MCEKMALVLAAGKGTRMKSDLPKVLVPVCGRPMIEYVLDALTTSGIERIIAVIGYRAELVRSALDGRKNLTFVLQAQQLGTGHAVMVCRDLLADHHGPVLIVAGDAPLMQADSIAALMAEYQRRPAACVIGTALARNPAGLGRIVRDKDGNFLGIVEHRDANESQRQIKEVSMSYYVFDCQIMLDALDYIRPNNDQGEYYITDLPRALLSRGLEVRAVPVLKPCEVLAINSMEELAVVEAEMLKTMKADIN